MRKQLSARRLRLLHVPTDHDEGQTGPPRSLIGHIFAFHGYIELGARVGLVFRRELFQQTLTSAKPYAAAAL